MNSHDFLNKYRKVKTAFTRNRKIRFVDLMVFIIVSVKKSLQLAINEYFGTTDPHSMPTKSAITQRRDSLDYAAFIALNDILVEKMYEDEELSYWNGYRLFGIDGTKLNLPTTQVLIQEFGTLSNKDGEYPMALEVSCVDLLNHIIPAARLEGCNKSELEVARRLIEENKEIGRKNDVLIFDRNFGAFWFFSLLLEKKLNFVIRLTKSLFPGEAEKEPGSSIIEINEPTRNTKRDWEKKGLTFHPIKVRVVRVKLDSGETELLATSFLDCEVFPDDVFKELYSMRWNHEESYKHQKAHIELEDFSGSKLHVVLQDFYAAIFGENLRVLFELGANRELSEQSKGKKLEHQYKVNRNLSAGELKRHIAALFTGDDQDDKFYENLRALFKIEPVPLRPGRHNPRIKKRSGRASTRYSLNQKRI